MRFWKMIAVIGMSMLILIGTVGCRSVFTPPYEIPEENEQVEIIEKTVYVYKIEYMDFAFIPEQEKQAWRQPLINLLNNEKIPRYSNGGDLLGYDYLYPDSPCIDIGRSLALFDVNVDGTPELLVNLGGGTAGNAFYAVYDIYTGRELGYMDGGHDDSWCTYFNTASGIYESIGCFRWRCGWMGQTTFVNKASIPDRLSMDEPEVYEYTWIETYYEIDMVEVPLTPEEKEKGYDSAHEDVYPGVKFWVNGDLADIYTYFDAQEDFDKNYVRIAETGITLVSWDSVTEEGDDVGTRAAKMADALLSLNQKFVVPLPESDEE